MALVTFFPKDPFSMLEAQPDFDVNQRCEVGLCYVLKASGTSG